MNASAHGLAAVAASRLYFTDQERRDGTSSAKPFVNGLLSAMLSKLPYLLEPATSPNHRQFFHSLAFVAVLFAG